MRVLESHVATVLVVVGLLISSAIAVGASTVAAGVTVEAVAHVAIVASQVCRDVTAANVTAISTVACRRVTSTSHSAKSSVVGR